jgi:hypothetical protein
MKLTYTRALSDPALLGPFFSGPSWNLTKAVVAAVNAEPLSAHQKELFASVAGGRAPPQDQVSRGLRKTRLK